MKKRILAAVFIIVSLALTLIAPISTAGAAQIIQQGITVSGGLSHSIAIGEDGAVMVWGSNSQNQLGLGSNVTERLTPTKIEGLTAVSVAAGHAFSAALTPDGRVQIWGAGAIEEPRIVQGLSDVEAIDAGQSDMLALRSDGTVWQWTVNTGTPQRVAGLDGIASISAGGTHYLALKHNGEVWAWGANAYGQLGVGTTADHAGPVKSALLEPIKYISAGFSHSLAVSVEGKVFAWGRNLYGELGTDEPESASTPQVVPKLSNIVQVSAGTGSSMALVSDGRLFTWGYGEYGQLGRGSNSYSVADPTVVNIALASRPTFISAGVHHSLYINRNGDLYSWGRNNAGQLGTNRDVGQNTPQRIIRNMLVTPNEYSTSPFTNAGSWALEDLSKLHDLDMMPLYFWSDYTSNMTRAELTYMMVRFYEQIKNTTARINQRSSSGFRDIEGHMFEEYIVKANQMGYVNGLSPTEFRPDGNVTRQQAAIILSNFVTSILNTTVPDTDIGLDRFADNFDIQSWARPAVSYVVENNIMQGSNNRFDPNGLMTRQQSMVMMYRILEQYNWLPK